MEISTIGFTRKSARDFFERLRQAGIRRLVDVRISNSSQLAGFSKRDDLEYFLRELCDAGYVHEPLLAPSQGLFDEFKKGGLPWQVYEARFLALLVERGVEQRIPRNWFATPTVLLCSEPTPERCHRRLVVEYLRSRWGDVTVRHL
jgi:uncharacterized protein (DUF488 family)